MDNFDLKKFLKESKALENLNPSIKSLNETSFSDRGNTQDYGSSPTERPDGTYDISNIMKETLKAKIKEIIVAELAEETATDMMDPVYEGDKTKEEEDEENEAYIEGGFGSFEEAKKKDEEVEDVEDVEITGEEDVPAADAEVTGAEDVPAADGGGIEDLAADMKGTEADLMDHLMKAFQIAKGMGNEKLETQVGNTLKFFVSEYIGGGQD